MCFTGNKQSLVYVDIHFLQCIDFFLHCYWIDDDSVSNDIFYSVMKNSGRYRMQNMFDSVELESMSRVWSTLEPGYNFIRRSKDIYNFSFSFIAPLEAEENVDWHFR